MSGRLTRGDWQTLGLDRLAVDGPAALRLERICAAAGRTRGSFYHHFADHTDFLDAVAEHWRTQHTEKLIALSRDGSPTDRLRSIRQLATSVDAAVELAMRRLGAANPRIRQVVADVDQRRIDYMTRLHRSRPGVTADQAASFAALEYAAYVGSQVLWPGADPEKLAQTADLLSDCLATIAAG